MKVTIRNDCIIIDGYVNAVGRDSKPIVTERGRCIEQIAPGTFSRALTKTLSKNKNIPLLLNHNSQRCLGSTADNINSVNLREDSIGLRATARLSDSEIMEKAKKGLLKGWSFGMHVINDKMEQREQDLPRRIVSELELLEVSILDENRTPAYAGTSIEIRDNEQYVHEMRVMESEVEIERQIFDYAQWERKINSLKKEQRK